MLKYILLTFMLFCVNIGISQEIFKREKRNFQWIVGDKSHDGWADFGATILDFSEEPPNIYNQYNAINFDIVNASICDTLGQYLFHTNGISIVNKEAEIIENGERINPGDFTDGWVDLGGASTTGSINLASS